MTCKTILSYCDGGDAAPRRLENAINVARWFDAHLTVLGVGYEADMPVYAMGDVVGPAIVEISARARALAQARADEAAARLARSGLLGDAVPMVSAYAALAGRLGRKARFADLVVLSRPYGKGAPETAAGAFDGAIMDGEAAVLVCPDEMAGFDPKTVLIAWTNSREALRALRAAIPILKRAERVELALFDPGVDAMDPAADAAKLLSRHGVNVEIAAHVRGPGTIAEAIATRIVDLGADLVVMGAYGSSRFREYVLGGVTRDMLTALPVPVFMAR
jgi:nucleotide-binding universal stress UspA family protein